MTYLQKAIMRKLYQSDIWEGFSPKQAADMQGWNSNHPSLQRLASTPGEKVVVDVGVWKGGSTINMALAMQREGIDGCVIAVDTFEGSPELWDAPLFRRTHGFPDIYWTFLCNVFHAGVTEYIVPMPISSVTAAAILMSKRIIPAVAHVDAAHTYEEVKLDANAYYDLLSPGGYLIGDDYHETWAGVIKGADEFAAHRGLHLKIEPPKWIVQKPA